MYVLSSVGDYSSGRAAVSLPAKVSQPSSKRKSSLKPRVVSESQHAETSGGTERDKVPLCPICSGPVSEAQTKRSCQSCQKRCHASCLDGKKGQCCTTSNSCAKCGNKIGAVEAKCLICKNAMCSTNCFHEYNVDMTGEDGFCESCFKLKTSEMLVIITQIARSSTSHSSSQRTQGEYFYSASASPLPSHTSSGASSQRSADDSDEGEHANAHGEGAATSGGKNGEGKMER